MISTEKLAELDIEAVLAEKQRRLDARLQIWSLLFALVSGFGLASVQQGTISYVVALYPLLAACLARFAGHGEAVLDQLKAYLLQVEQQAGYAGYETYNKGNKLKTSSSGGHKKALLQALILTEILATIVITWRLVEVTMLWQSGIVLFVEAIAVISTVRFLREEKK